MKERQTVYFLPCCSVLHSELLQVACDSCPWDIRIIPGSTASSVRMGLRGVNNDACYETIAIVGRLLEAYDALEKDIACDVIIPRYCADCRSMDAMAFVGRSFIKMCGIDIAAYDVTDLLRAMSSIEGRRFQQRIGLALWAGDVIFQGVHMIRPGASVENVKIAAAYQEKWIARARRIVETNAMAAFSQFCEQAMFEAIDLIGESFWGIPEIALVGTAPILYDEYMNAGAIAEFEREGCRVSLPTLASYVRWNIASVAEETELGLQLGRLGSIVRELDLPLRRLATRVRLLSSVTGVVPAHLRFGDGWRIAAQIAFEAEHGVRNFVYISTFGCLSGHIMGKGVLHWARGLAEDINVSAIEYDPGTSAVNQANRIKLIASLAKGSAAEATESDY